MSYNYNYSNGAVMDGDNPEDNLKVTVREVGAPFDPLWLLLTRSRSNQIESISFYRDAP